MGIVVGCRRTLGADAVVSAIRLAEAVADNDHPMYQHDVVQCPNRGFLAAVLRGSHRHPRPDLVIEPLAVAELAGLVEERLELGGERAEIDRAAENDRIRLRHGLVGVCQRRPPEAVRRTRVAANRAERRTARACNLGGGMDQQRFRPAGFGGGEYALEQESGIAIGVRAAIDRDNQHDYFPSLTGLAKAGF